MSDVISANTTAESDRSRSALRCLWVSCSSKQASKSAWCMQSAYELCLTCQSHSLSDAIGHSLPSEQETFVRRSSLASWPPYYSHLAFCGYPPLHLPSLLPIYLAFDSPQYYEIYKYREVIGISIPFMVIDLLGGVFSDLSLVFKPKFDVIAGVAYSLVVVSIKDKTFYYAG